jgi:hypothetical protein
LYGFVTSSGQIGLYRLLPFLARRYVIGSTMETRDERSGFEIWRAVINVGGLAIAAGVIALIVATILTG